MPRRSESPPIPTLDHSLLGRALPCQYAQAALAPNSSPPSFYPWAYHALGLSSQHEQGCPISLAYSTEQIIRPTEPPISSTVTINNMTLHQTEEKNHPKQTQNHNASVNNQIIFYFKLNRKNCQCQTHNHNFVIKLYSKLYTCRRFLIRWMDRAIAAAWLFQSLSLSSRIGHWLAIIPSTVRPSEVEASAAAWEPNCLTHLELPETWWNPDGFIEVSIITEENPVTFFPKKPYPEHKTTLFEFELEKFRDCDTKSLWHPSGLSIVWITYEENP